tara:strand:+ start:2036 stop:2149 length:114 start_codon:yes stop_codon:yes gene_type:complete
MISLNKKLDEKYKKLEQKITFSQMFLLSKNSKTLEKL